MEYELVTLLVNNLGYAKLLKLINEYCNTFGVEIVWHAKF